MAHIRGGDLWDVDAPEKTLRLVARLLAVRPMLFPSSFRADPRMGDGVHGAEV